MTTPKLNNLFAFTFADCNNKLTCIRILLKNYKDVKLKTK